MRKSDNGDCLNNREIVDIDLLLGRRKPDDDGRTMFRIGDLAQEFGVTLRTLRFYEDRGLLTPERRGTTRLYSRRDRARLRMILLAKRLGFSLTEAKQIIEIYDQPDGQERQLRFALQRFEEQQAILEEQRQEIEDSIRTMSVTVDYVRSLLKKQD